MQHREHLLVRIRRMQKLESRLHKVEVVNVASTEWDLKRRRTVVLSASNFDAFSPTVDAPTSLTMVRAGDQQRASKVALPLYLRRGYSDKAERTTARTYQGVRPLENAFTEPRGDPIKLLINLSQRSQPKTT